MSLVVSVAITVGDGDTTYITQLESETVLLQNTDSNDWSGTVTLASLALDRIVERQHSKTSESMSELAVLLENV